MNDFENNEPIILIGAARSGTTLVGDVLSKHPDIAYWIEPKYIWKYKNPNLKNDFRYAKEASEKVSTYIKLKFLKIVIKSDKKRFLEKTPSNCFRVPFINEVYKDAVFLNIIRDGRDVSMSAYKKWTTKHDKSAYKRRLTLNEIPLVDLPFYIFNFIKLLIFQWFFPGKLKEWGPMSPLIIEYAKKSVEEACAIQWKQSTEVSILELQKIDQSRVFTFKYEDFLKSPDKILDEIFKICKLSDSSEVRNFAHEIIRPNNSKKWEKKENIDFVGKINHIIKPMNESLGY